ncbi:MAG: 50S ribosomal protein L22 [Anaerolineales bacterium]|jgi:large subunit ribosomal protein L22|nr:50S ribosomal protein L22 [Anaerolineales bacterium]MBS3752296.1 50S ribosomal protein L22 [Anaerolineales bacterium]
MPRDVEAKARHVPISPQKARLVVDMVRGKEVVDALDILKFTPNKAARSVTKVLNSAVANAEHNFGLNRYDLYVHHIVADEGPTRKWRRFGARGRVKPRLRRSSHISVVLREREEE